MDDNEILEIWNLCEQRYKMADDYISGRMHKLAKSLTEAEIPGYEDKHLKFGDFEQKEFVVMMTDIRKSTEIIHSFDGRRKMFLIYYIYSSIVSKIVDKFDGTSTEFLGDGVLNLFSTEEKGLKEMLKQAYRASNKLLLSRFIMNHYFKQKELPQIDFGIGIDFGETIVTRFGYNADNDLKAFGECIYDVSRLSKGINLLYVSKKADDNWESSPGGNLSFQLDTTIDGIGCYKAITT